MLLKKKFLAGLFSVLAVVFGLTSSAFAVYPYPIKPFPFPKPVKPIIHYHPIVQETHAHDGTGMTLGVYVEQNMYGMQIIGLMPNSSAQFAGLRSGDILLEMYSNGNFFPTTNLYELRAAKLSIGPNQLVYVRVFRPGFGEFYPTVTFQLDGFGGGPAVAYSKNGVAAMKAPAMGKWSGETAMSKSIFKNRPMLKIDPKANSVLKVDPNKKVDPNVKIIVPNVENKNSNPWLNK
jgi:hypothetical protein